MHSSFDESQEFVDVKKETENSDDYYLIYLFLLDYDKRNYPSLSILSRISQNLSRNHFPCHVYFLIGIIRVFKCRKYRLGTIAAFPGNYFCFLFSFCFFFFFFSFPFCFFLSFPFSFFLFFFFSFIYSLF